jgi:hypothetical protein
MSFSIGTDVQFSLDPAQHLPNRLLASFPGWGAADYADHLAPIARGSWAVITSVQSHGSAPYTRYSVRFADGSRAHDVFPPQFVVPV